MSWREAHLGDVIRLKRGHDLPASDRVPGEIPIVSSSGVTGFHNVAKVAGPGVVTGRYGTLGEVHYIEDDYWPLNTALYVEDFKGNRPRYIAYLLMTLELGSQNAAGAVPGVNRNTLHQMRVRVPDEGIQSSIVEVLSAYDDLIATNQRRIALLEDAARRLYREWFVHLRFPGHESVPVKDGVPQGWQATTFADLVHINPRTPFEKGVERPFVEMSALSETAMVIGPRSQRVIGGGAKFRNGDTLFARITPCIENGKTGFVQFLEDENAVASGSTEFIVMRSEKVNPWWVYCASREDAFREHAIRSMSGSDGRQRVNSDCFAQLATLLPPQSVLEQFESAVADSFALVEQLTIQNTRLAQARDLLLPRLMSGQLDVSGITLPGTAHPEGVLPPC
jgi:type I restriction enzyme S subunit